MVQRRLSHAQENPVTAIDIALEPDATMVRQAEADNARLLKAYPEGFALDATHHAHITMLQQFLRTADLEKVYSAANAVLAKEGVASRRLKAIKYYYIPSPPLGIAGIVVEATEDLLRLQYELLDAVAPFTEKTGTAAAFVSTDGGRDIQQGLIDYVANFTTVAAGKKFNPHVTIGQVRRGARHRGMAFVARLPDRSWIRRSRIRCAGPRYDRGGSQTKGESHD